MVLLNLIGFSTLTAKKIIERSKKRAKQKNVTPSKIQRLLKKSLSYATPNKADSFYTNIKQSILEAVALKTKTEANSLTTEAIQKELTDHKVSAANINRIINLIERCNFARYAPSASHSEKEMKSVYKEAKKVMELIF